MSIQDAASGVALWRQVADGIERGIAVARLPPAKSCRAKRRSPKPTGSTATPCGGRWRRWPSAAWCAPSAAAAPMSRPPGSPIPCARARGFPRSSAPAAASRDGRLIGASEELATRELARLLALKTGAPLIRIEVLRLADRTPICVSTIWLRRGAFSGGRPGLSQRARSMTKLLAHYGIRDYRRASTRVTAAIVDATDAARLDLALGRPVLVVDSTDVDTEGTPLVTKRSRFAAERVEFVVENG